MGLEKSADKIREEWARAKCESIWGAEVLPNPKNYPFDWQVMSPDKNCLAICEFKSSNWPLEKLIAEYGGFRVGIRKFTQAYPIPMMSAIPFMLVFKALEDDLYVHSMTKDFLESNSYPITRFYNQRTGVKNDIEPAVLLTPNMFKKVSEDDFDPLYGVAY